MGMTLEQIKESVDELKHSLYIRGIDQDGSCRDLYYRMMYIQYNHIINNVVIKDN